MLLLKNGAMTNPNGPKNFAKLFVTVMKKGPKILYTKTVSLLTLRASKNQGSWMRMLSHFMISQSFIPVLLPVPALIFMHTIVQEMLVLLLA